MAFTSSNSTDGHLNIRPMVHASDKKLNVSYLTMLGEEEYVSRVNHDVTSSLEHTLLASI